MSEYARAEDKKPEVFCKSCCELSIEIEATQALWTKKYVECDDERNLAIKALEKMRKEIDLEWSAVFHKPEEQWLKGWRHACMTLSNKLKTLGF